MNPKITTAALLAFASLILSTTVMLSGCKKETPATTTSDTTQTAPAASSTTTTAPASAPTDTTKQAGFSGKALVGQKLFYSTSLGKLKISCSSCHTDGQATTQDDRIRSGHTLVGVTSRTATWNGMFKAADLKKYAYGGALCAAVYEKSADNGDYTKGLSPDQADALNEYFTAIATVPNAKTKNLTIQWATKPAFRDEDNVDDKPATAAAKAILKLPGDANSGQVLFTKTCQYCHAMTEKKIGPSFKDAMKDINFAAKTLRVGSNAMVFYGKDILTDQQCSDILAYIQQQLGE
jgi:cytochrome c2